MFKFHLLTSQTIRFPYNRVLHTGDIMLLLHVHAPNVNWKIANDFQVYCQQLNWLLTYGNDDGVHRNHFISFDTHRIPVCALEKIAMLLVEVMPADCGYDDDTAHTHSHAHQNVNDKN